MKGIISTLVQRRAFNLMVVAFVALPFCTVYADSPTVALLLQQTPSQGGIVTPTAGVYQFDPNSAVTLSAMPKVGYQFVCWLGDVVDTSSSVTSTYLDKPKIIIAVFEQTSYDHSAGNDQIIHSSSGGGSSRSSLRHSRGYTTSTSYSGSSASPTYAQASTGNVSSGTVVIIPDVPGTDEPGEPAVPEPATIILLGLGGLTLLKKRSRR